MNEPLLNATESTTASLPGSGVVSLTAWENGGGHGECSGVLLTNRWMLSAAHCFCASNIANPNTVIASVYGSTADTDDPGHADFYSTVAARIFRNPILDVALVQLAQTLPYTTSPLLTTNVVGVTAGQTGRAWGFGGNRIGSGNTIGAGEALYFGDFNLSGQTSLNAQPVHCGTDPDEPVNLSTGPQGFGAPGNGGPTQIAEGDSGGPLFIGTDSSTRVLVGIANQGNHWTNPGLLLSWIGNTADDMWRASGCRKLVPGSAGAGPAAIAPGPDGAIHVVAPMNHALMHWRFNTFGGLMSSALIANTNTDDAPGLGSESSGSPPRLALAYRDRSTNMLKYVRWTQTGGWASPLAAPGIRLGAGPAIGGGGTIAFMNVNNAMFVNSYDPVGRVFNPAVSFPASAPLADPSKRISVGDEMTYGFSVIGYRTTTGAWIQAVGSSVCPNFICSVDPPFANSWESAMLTYGQHERFTIVTTQTLPGNPFPRLVNRVTPGGTNLPWGDSRTTAFNQPGVAHIGHDIFAVTQWLDGNLYIEKADNCTANDF